MAKLTQQGVVFPDGSTLTSATGIAGAIEATGTGGVEYLEQASAPDSNVVADGTMWLDTTDDVLYQLHTGDWIQISDDATAVSVLLDTWTITEVGGDILFAKAGVNKLRVAQNGTITTVNDVAAFGSV